jgi:hypothetical protein
MSDPPINISGTISADIPTITVRPTPGQIAQARAGSTVARPQGNPAGAGPPGQGGEGQGGPGGTGQGDGRPADAPLPQPDVVGQHVFWLRKWSLTLSSANTFQASQPIPGEHDPTGGAPTVMRGFGPRAGPGDATLPEVVVTAKRDPPSAGGIQDGQTIDLSEFHIIFEVTKTAFQTPRKLTARVYNPGRDLMAKIDRQFTQVRLEAGYQHQPYGEIFKGTVAYFEKGRDSGTDTVLVIYANEADQNINLTVINKTLPAGSTDLDIVKACATEMQVELGQISPLSTAKSPRSRALHGMCRDVLRDVALSNNANVSIDNGKLNMIAQGDRLNVPAIVLNQTTGMIDIPRLTLNGGLHVTSLLNPDLKPNGSIRVNQRDVYQITEVKPGMDLSQAEQLQNRTRIAGDGGYKVLTVTHRGDNRGNEWYSILETMPLDPDKIPVGPH